MVEMGRKIFTRHWRSSRAKKSPQPAPVVSNVSSTPPIIHLNPSLPPSPIPSTTLTERIIATTVITTLPIEVERIGLIHLNKDTPIPDTYSEGTFPIDVIAVHGLNGGAYSTFTHANGTFWLRDLLPKELPGARIYSFGYEAKVFMSLSVGGVEEFARELLEDIRSERPTAALRRRPIIFICHSMGGIVVKKALNIATIDHVRYSLVQKATVAIFFLATPHGGSAAASPGAVAAKLSNLPFIGRFQVSNVSLIASLKLDSPELQNIARDFRHLSRDIKIYTFEEQEKASWVGMVVTQKSGSMNTDTEVVIPMGGYDHRSICRFEGEQSVGYKRVLDKLREVAIEVTNRLHVQLLEEDWPCLQSLSFPGIEQRTTGHNQHPMTCSWLQQHPAYKDFISSTSPEHLLLLKGLPGSGKSTLMSSLYSKYSKQPSDARDICLSFFFRGNGSILQRSKLGMLRALLWQMYQQSVDARNIISARWKEKQAGLGSQWTWVVDELCELLGEVLCRQRGGVLVFVDAADEAADENGRKLGTEILAYLRLLNLQVCGADRKIRICVSCRHYPVMTAGSDTVEIVVEESNAHDLMVFVRSQLQNGVEGWTRFPHSERTGLEKAIVQTAAGVFLWADLRLRKIAKSLNDGACGIGDLTALIETESNELFPMYQKILENDLDNSVKERAFLLMQWICLAERPLTLEELRLAMACDGLSDDGLTDCLDVKDFVRDDQRMERLVCSLSGGLAVLVSSEAQRNTVQLFHATVYDFLRDRGLRMLLSNPHNTIELEASDNIIGVSQVRLSRSCLLYLSIEALLKRASMEVGTALEEYGFLDYATRFWLAHAERAEHLGIAQEGILDVLESQPRMCEIWRMIYYTISRHDPKRPEQFIFAPIHVGALWNLQSMVRRLLQNGALVDEVDQRSNTALHHSCRLGNYQITELLLKNGANIEAGSTTPIEFAASNGHDEIVRLLLKYGADTERNCHGGNALYLAAEQGYLSTVRILFKAGVDLNTRGGHQGNALKAAAYEQQLAVVEFLVDSGVDVNQQGGYFGTALHAAVSSRGDKRMQMIHLLLQAGANPNLVGCGFGNALQAAAKRGSLSLVKTFIEHGGDITISEGTLGSPLQVACKSLNCEELVTFLLDSGCDVNAVGGEYGTALQAAASGGKIEIVQILLEHGADIHLEGGQYGSALQAAASSPGPEVAQVLMNAGAKEVVGGYYGNLLQAAVSGANYDLAKQLLGWGADINKRGGLFESALQAAVDNRSSAFVSFLLEKGADPNIIGGDYGSPLQAAVTINQETIVKILLANGADVNAVAPDGTFALQTAAGFGRLGIAKLLLDSGAQVDLYKFGWQGTALYMAVFAGQKAIVDLLLRRGAKLYGRAGYWDSAFHACIASMNMTNFLLERTASLGQPGASASM